MFSPATSLLQRDMSVQTPTFVPYWSPRGLLYWWRRMGLLGQLPVWFAGVTFFGLVALPETPQVARPRPATAVEASTTLLESGGRIEPQKASLSVIQGYPRVVDGDTLVFGSTRVRLFGMDAFETKQLCRRPVQPPGTAALEHRFESYPCGREATAHLSKLVDTKPVVCVPRGRDPFQRVVAKCSVSGAPGEEIDLGQTMVRDGWAVAFRRYSTLYVPDEESAREQRRGVWASFNGHEDEASLFECPAQWRLRQRQASHRRH
jgi:endonuclease YncB( thermonuclease family)